MIEILNENIMDESGATDQAATSETPPHTSWLARIRFLLLFLTLLLAVFTGVQRWIYTAAHFELQQIVVNGNRYLSDEDVVHLLAIPRGTNIFEVSLEGVENKLQKNIRIKAVKAIRQVPGAIVLNIEEREPVALIKIGQYFREVDREGLILPEIHNGIFADLVMITGLETGGLRIGDRISDERLFKAIQVIDELERIESGWSAEFSEIYAEDPHDLVIYPINGGQKARVDYANCSTQLERFKIVSEQLGREKELVKGFDLRFQNQVVVKR